ncbi:MAG: hypothetical protein ACLR02_02550 [Clostridium sp.]|jgi:hypothetical protein|nr:hypothetical protein [Clostridium sp.]
MYKCIIRDITTLANKIAEILQQEDPYTTVIIKDSQIKIVRDEYVFSVKKAVNTVDHQSRA